VASQGGLPHRLKRGGVTALGRVSGRDGAGWSNEFPLLATEGSKKSGTREVPSCTEVW